MQTSKPSWYIQHQGPLSFHPFRVGKLSSGRVKCEACSAVLSDSNTVWTHVADDAQFLWRAVDDSLTLYSSADRRLQDL